MGDKRSPEAIFDPWGIEPTLTMNSLLDLAEHVDLEINAGNNSCCIS